MGGVEFRAAAVESIMPSQRAAHSLDAVRRGWPDHTRKRETPSGHHSTRPPRCAPAERAEDETPPDLRSPRSASSSPRRTRRRTSPTSSRRCPTSCRRSCSWTAARRTTPSPSPAGSVPDVIVVPQSYRGKGDALACGFAVASGDIIVMIDADGSTDPGEIPLLRRGAGRRRRLRQGQPLPARRRQRRPHLHPPLGQRGPHRARQPAVRRALHRPLLRLQRLLARLPHLAQPGLDGFEIETQLNLRRSRSAWPSRRCRAWSATASTARATSTPSVTGCGCCGRSCASASAPSTRRARPGRR